MDEIELCEKVASGLFQMASEMRDRGMDPSSVSAFELVADSIESDRDQPDMQALARAMAEAIGLR